MQKEKTKNITWIKEIFGGKSVFMIFDQKELQSTFEMKIGRPGSSFAFEIATKTGLDPKILKYAKSKTGKDIDMVILNHGGIRSIISKGNITTRTAYQLMPFENSIVVVALKGSQIDSLTNYLRLRERAHPISKLKLIVNKDFDIVESSIKGEKIDKEKTYYVATNDYLYNNSENNMRFFKPNDSLYILNYKVRNALIDHFKKVDTISPVIDDRFIQVN